MMPPAAVSSPSWPADVVLTGQFEPEQARRVVHVPFRVPAGVRQLHVRYDYPDRISADPLHRGGNTLDIGLFDERGLAAGGPGFRGWSGSDRAAFTIADGWATPPYRPGPIGAGEWHVLLGPYKVGPRGLDYRVEVWFDPGFASDRPPPPRRDPPVRATLPPAVEPGWVRGDLHCHTVYSDGDSWPIEVLIAAAEAGLDFLGITDHNGAVRPTVDPAAAAGLPTLLAGIEVTTYGGHWNAWGAEGWFDFRDPTPAGVEAAMAAAVAAGAFIAVNHPKPFGPPWTYPDEGAYHAIEVWNGPWERMNCLALAWWDARLRRGERLVAVGGSDTHFLRRPAPGPLAPARLGEPTTWVRVDGTPTAAALLAGLGAGRCFVSATPAGPQLYLTRSGGGARARVVGARGATLVCFADAGPATTTAIGSDDWASEVPFPPGASYVRAQVVGSLGNLLAVSNPVWRDEVE